MTVEKEIKRFVNDFSVLAPAMIKTGDKSINAFTKLDGWEIRIHLVKDNLYGKRKRTNH